MKRKFLPQAKAPTEMPTQTDPTNACPTGVSPTGSNKPPRRRFSARTGVMCLSALLTLLIGTASYSLARYGSSLREDPSARVATFSVNYTHRELIRTGINDSKENVSFTQGASTVVIQDVV